jgi:RNA:NAD 2'-phosphotransferase (TPT1/KptA family)
LCVGVGGNRTHAARPFNNLLYAIEKRALSEALEHRAGRVGMNLRFKGYSKTNEILTTAAAKNKR